MSARSNDPANHPPQFVFEMIAAQATRHFLSDAFFVEDVAADYTSRFEDLYSSEHMQDDLLQAIDRMITFIGSVQISDVDLLLLSFIWYTANYERHNVKRNKKPLFSNPLKGRPREIARVYNTAVALKAYAYGMGSQKVPVKPTEWKPEDEVEFAPIFTRLFPPPEDAPKPAKA
jgi:hypothetical protein